MVLGNILGRWMFIGFIWFGVGRVGCYRRKVSVIRVWRGLGLCLFSFEDIVEIMGVYVFFVYGCELGDDGAWFCKLFFVKSL